MHPLRSKLSNKINGWFFGRLYNLESRTDAENRALVPKIDHLASQFIGYENASEENLAIISQVIPYTLVHELAILSLLETVEHVVRNNVPGDFVECGVCLGGASMAVALKLQALGDTERNLILCDTFKGAPRPERDDDEMVFHNVSAQQMWDRAANDERSRALWFDDFYDKAKSNMLSTGYPEDKLIFLRGKVEDTLPSLERRDLAILRLDTDWYESTKCELETLYDWLSSGGALIIDDYGACSGARDATDEFFANGRHARPLLQRVNCTVRQGVKP